MMGQNAYQSMWLKVQSFQDLVVATPAAHWGQGVVSWAGTLQVHCKDMDKVPGKNPPGTF